MKNIQFESPTYGEKSKREVFEYLAERIRKTQSDCKVIIGTDSQNTYKTKMVLVICILEESKGGNFFYHIDWLPKITTLNNKIFMETEMSLELARDLNSFLHARSIRPNVEIHVDIGKDGKTKDLIQSILGWVTAEGMKCKIKPDSFVASTIADKISK